MALPFVTVGVPVYKGKEFIVETLHSIQSQTYKNINVIISLDGSDPECEELCKPFLQDSRFHLVVQPKQLGWVHHINWLMSQVKTPFWYCHPHDDLVSPDYVQVLLSAAEKMPKAAVVYCDIKTFGKQSNIIRQSSILGKPVVRQLWLLYKHHSAVAFRGLTRIEALRNAGEIRPNAVDSFSSDTVWMAAMARWGNLQRIPKEMYYKRYHLGNEHTKWTTWTKEKITKAWTLHCVDMLEQAMLVEANGIQKEFLWLAAMKRLYTRYFGYSSIASSTISERIKLYKDFLYHVKNRENIDIPSHFIKLENIINRIKGSGSG